MSESAHLSEFVVKDNQSLRAARVSVRVVQICSCSLKLICKLMAGTKFSDYLGLNHNKKAKKLKYFIHLRLTNRPQSFGS